MEGMIRHLPLASLLQLSDPAASPRLNEQIFHRPRTRLLKKIPFTIYALLFVTGRSFRTSLHSGPPDRITHLPSTVVLVLVVVLVVLLLLLFTITLLLIYPPSQSPVGLAPPPPLYPPCLRHRPCHIKGNHTVDFGGKVAFIEGGDDHRAHSGSKGGSATNEGPLMDLAMLSESVVSR